MFLYHQFRDKKARKIYASIKTSYTRQMTGVLTTELETSYTPELAFQA
jgi:hypothetical protein